MAAPKDNQYWKKRTKHGRDAIFEDIELFKGLFFKYLDFTDKNPDYVVEQIKTLDKGHINEKGKFVPPARTIRLPKKRPYTLKGFCIFLGVNSKYFCDFEERLSTKTDEVSKDFSDFIIYMKDVIFDNKYVGAVNGFYNPNIISRELGLVDKKEVEHSGHLSQTIISKEEAQKIAEDLENQV